MMENKEYNLLLIERFPQLAEAYSEETSWQEGDDTGCHVVYGDVLTPYIESLIAVESCEVLRRVFDFLEELAQQGDLYIDEVLQFSVLEKIADNTEYLRYCKPMMQERLLEMIRELQTQ